MQFIDLKTQFERIEGDVMPRIDAVLKSQHFIMGSEVSELEGQLAAFAGVKHAFACSSGTDALVISLMAIGLQKSDAVFVPSFTFFASPESISLAGGTPVFVDSDPVTFDISAQSLEDAIARVEAEGKLTPKGVIPVDLFGQPADYDAIHRIADKHGLFILEDAAQGFGAIYHGKRTGGLGTVGATSFYPAKPLGCYGDGGAIFTDDDELAGKIASVRVHGMGSDKYDNVRMGVNGRLDTIQAAVLLSKLTVFQDELDARQKVAARYDDLLGQDFVTPKIAEGCVSSWAQYTIMAKDAAQRERILDGMKKKGLPTSVFYPIPAHLSTAYKYLGYKKGDLPVCEAQAERVFSIPMHPYLTQAEQEAYVAALKECE